MSRILVVAAVAAYVATLFFVHKHFIAPAFAYLGAVYIPPSSVVLVLIGLLVSAFPSFIIPIHVQRPSVVFHWILYLLLFIPCIIVPVISTGHGVYQLVPLQLTLLSSFMLLHLLGRLPPVSLPWVRIAPRQFWLGISIVSVFSYALIFRQYGVSVSLPALGSAYDVREEYRHATAGGNALPQYALHWQSKVINPLVISYGIIKRRPEVIAVGFLGQLAIYSVSGLRAVLFSIGILAGVLFCFGRRGRTFGAKIALGSVGLVALCIVFDSLMNSVTLSSLFVRRLILTPGLLMGQYFNFFEVNPFVFLSNSVLSPFYHYPYTRSYPFEVGMFVSGNPLSFFNAGIWPDAYANFGLIGIPAFTLILGLILWLLDSVSLGRHLWLVAGVAALPAWSLVNSGLFTAMMTHGILLLLVIVYLLPRTSGLRADNGPTKGSTKAGNDG